MSGSLDMSLDDLIRNNKRSGAPNSNFRGRGSGSSGPGPARRFANSVPIRTAPYSTRQPVQVPQPVWQQQMLMSGRSAAETGTRLYVSNLDYGVSNEDIKMLFSEVGDLKRYSIHYDRSGRSKGTAEVVFLRQIDALAAIKRYNNVQLDGKPINIELVGVNLVTPLVPPTTNGILGNPTTNSILGNPTTNSILGNPKGAFRSLQERVGGRGWVRGGGGGGGSSSGFGRGRGQGRGLDEKKISADDLDADLEKYHLEAMQIN